MRRFAEIRSAARGVACRCRPAFVLGTLLLVACSPGREDGLRVETDGSQPEPATEALFVDIARSSGLDFVHDNGMTGESYFVEPVGSGAALADFDDDGDLDVLLVQGGPLDDRYGCQATTGELRTRVFRNDLADPRTGAGLHFTDVTEQSGLTSGAYGMGVATGDYDNDGRIDLYLSNFGCNRLWRNTSEGDQLRFVDVTETAGVEESRWSTSATFVDLDADGWLDLFVANYVDFTLEKHRPCRSPGGRLDYCGPQSFEGETDRVWLNQRDGTFRDITGTAGLLGSPSSGLGVVAADFDLDGRLDLYVANDLRRNFQWRNLGPDSQGLPHFQNTALLSGSAVSRLGRAQASMGVIAEDLDNDGDDDLFMTHLSMETNTLYLNGGAGDFDDQSTASGLAAPSLDATGFGTAALDFDNDGLIDLASANGAVKVIEAQRLAGSDYPLAQANQLFHNRGNGQFDDHSHRAGPEFERLEVSRGMAVGDVDNDGRSDILLANNHGPARLLHNRSNDDHHWLGLRLLTAPNGRDALGARISVVRRDGTRLWRRVKTDGSYLSARDPRVRVGLGAGDGPATVRVTWLDGTSELFANLQPDRYHALVRGTGTEETR